jgi:hypothetical protein
VARILGAVSSVTGGKVSIHFQVAASGEQERSSSLRRWMRQGPHALCVHVGCAGAVTSVSSYARLESGIGGGVCVTQGCSLCGGGV